MGEDVDACLSQHSLCARLCHQGLATRTVYAELQELQVLAAQLQLLLLLLRSIAAVEVGVWHVGHFAPDVCRAGADADVQLHAWHIIGEGGCRLLLRAVAHGCRVKDPFWAPRGSRCQAGVAAQLRAQETQGPQAVCSKLR